MADQMVSMTNRAEVPNHVPAERVKEFDFFLNPDMAKCPFTTVYKLHAGGVFWNPTSYRPEGSWVFTRAEDIRYILNNPQIFLSKGASGFSQLMGEDWDMIPLEVDQPDHAKFRQLLNPLFAPGAVAKLSEGVSKRAIDLIEAAKKQGHCEFMEAFGRPFPVSIFMQLMGLPEDQTERFLNWEHMLLHVPELETKIAGAKSIREYLVDLAEERRAELTGDLTSFVVSAEVAGSPLTDIEVLGVLYLLFVAGLDTVASSLGWFFQYLAEHQDQQAWLRANPDAIPGAVEELLRRYSVVTNYRQCKVDVQVGDVRLLKGDWITIVDALASLDPEEFENPLEVDFNRKAVRHLGFSFGPHFCLGSHLARRELQAALREWLGRIPQWRIKAGTSVDMHGGAIFGIDRLELEW